MPLGSRLLEERDQVRSVLGLLEPSEHLYTGPPASSAPPLAAVLEPEEEVDGRGGAEAGTEPEAEQAPIHGSRQGGGSLHRWRWQVAEPEGRAEEGRRTILVPGMYAFGLSRYMNRCSSPHVMPVAKRR